MIYKEGHSSYGHCWIEGDGNIFWVYIMNGSNRRGPYSSLLDAFTEFSHYCVSRSENRSCTGFEPHSRRSQNRTSDAHLTAHGLPDIISTAHIV